MTNETLLVGIDTGANTGFAVARAGKLCVVETLPIHQAMDRVRALADEIRASGGRVRVEDARKRKWIPNRRGRDAAMLVFGLRR